MRRFRLRFTVPALGVFVAVGLLAALGTGGSAPAAVKRVAAVKRTASPKVSVIAVTLGKPSELAFKLSKTSMVPAGTITFKVTNMGVAFHNFKLCAKSIASATDVSDAKPVLEGGLPGAPGEFHLADGTPLNPKRTIELSPEQLLVIRNVRRRNLQHQVLDHQIFDPFSERVSFVHDR